ncbi:unnamed protein product [Dovyalis caffra]|uniref:Uncharacterized protein n=1 Tax=Dovyalis caffra TaxID=77055 RepID=A0AAV1SQQ5_9ROSI|nr:unnamed protein product [Dovyalis caffra]
MATYSFENSLFDKATNTLSIHSRHIEGRNNERVTKWENQLPIPEDKNSFPFTNELSTSGKKKLREREVPDEREEDGISDQHRHFKSKGTVVFNFGDIKILTR